jgi:hypothetical protein
MGRGAVAGPAWHSVQPLLQYVSCSLSNLSYTCGLPSFLPLSCACCRDTEPRLGWGPLRRPPRILLLALFPLCPLTYMKPLLSLIHICISFSLSPIGLCPVRSCSSVSTTV